MQSKGNERLLIKKMANFLGNGFDLSILRELDAFPCFIFFMLAVFLVHICLSG